MKRLLGFLLVLACCLPLSGCGGRGENRILNYISPGGATNFDPQFTTQSNAKLVLHNICEGLLVLQADGSLQPGLAERYEMQPDGLRYTFYLREGLQWADESPLTANDFVFAFNRMFNPQAFSPYAADYRCLRGAAQLLEGQQAELGVYAPDDRTVVFELETPNVFFLQQVADPSAFPCQEAFFRQTRGKYGLGKDYILANGPFSITTMEEDYVSIRRNSCYYAADTVVPRGVNIHFRTDSTPYDKLINGNVQLAEVSYEQLQVLCSRGFQYDGFDNTVWILCFNPNNTFLQNEQIRCAIVQTIDQQILSDSLDENLNATRALLPPTVRVGSRSYRSLAPDVGTIFDTEAAREALISGMEQLSLRSLPNLTLLVRQEGSHTLAAGAIQRQLQQQLSLFVNANPLPEADFNAALLRGDYDLVIRPITYEESTPTALLRLYASDSGQNLFGFSNSEYDQLLEEMSAAVTEAELAGLAARAEQLLLDAHCFIPLYTQTRYLAFSPKSSGFSLSHDLTRIYFKEVYEKD